MNNITLQGAADTAVNAIVALRKMSNPLPYSRHKRLPRSVQPIYRRYAAELEAMGFNPLEVTRLWYDVIDLVVLEDNSEE